MDSLHVQTAEGARSGCGPILQLRGMWLIPVQEVLTMGFILNPESRQVRRPSSR
jgi:hypothetical protein